MRILFCEWGSVCEVGIRTTIEQSEHKLIEFNEGCGNFDYDTEYMNKLSNFIQNSDRPDVVLSINFIPIISRLCKVYRIPYISWTVDSPCLTLYSETVSYECNYIFIFDRMLAEKLSVYNPGHIFHLPLGCNTDTLDLPVTEQHMEQFGCDVSFIGSLYTEKCRYDEIEAQLPEYMKGYIEGVLRAQQNVFGYSLMEDTITPKMAAEFRSYVKWATPPDYREDDIGIMIDHYLARKCTTYDRPDTLRAVSEHFRTDLWTLSDTASMPKVNNRGPADSSWMTPRIYKCSKINLNITLRSIKSGIPQRVFDVLGAGGFLISNYQIELAEFFVPDEELVMYESVPDLIQKIDYYLAHEEERKIIAENGHRKVQTAHSLKSRLEDMLSVL